MRYLSILFVFLIVAACGESEQAQTKDVHEEHRMEAADTTRAADEQLIYYNCPMEEHKHVHSGEPGECPECGMTLVAGVVTSEDKMEYYGCPMEIHSHVRSDEPGTCDECGMELKPMRLVKK
jgi:hypothetical protein